MRNVSFEFDPAKAAANLKKHRVSFREAVTVFNDPLAQTFPDELHSEDEDRSITITYHLGTGSCSFHTGRAKTISALSGHGVQP
jgi:uncharacterized DUF497 family protein